MPGHQPPISGTDRPGQVRTALRLAWISVAFGAAAEAWHTAPHCQPPA
jgi:hypothetical protein